LSTILLVDDEKILRTLVRFAIERRNHHLIEASSARQAIALSQHHEGPIDLLVASLSLPDMSGHDLAELLRTERPGVRALLLSRAPKSAGALAEAGAKGIQILVEPFEISDLLESIEEILAPRRRRPPARSQRAQSVEPRAGHGH